MCEHCLDTEYAPEGRPEVTPEMWRLAGLCWDWYRLPGNDVGGVLHVVLDDMNVEDHCLDFCTKDGHHWSFDEGADMPTLLAARDEIIAGLRPLSLAERAMVTWVADPYGSARPVAP